MKGTGSYLALLIFPLLFITGCRSTYSSNVEWKEAHPLQIGICHPGSFWPEENNHFKQAPSSYERQKWGGYLSGRYKQELLDEMGIQWVRVDFSWKNLEPEQDEWYFKNFDRFVAGAREQNKKVLAVLAYDVHWRYDKDGSCRNIQPEELHHYLNYVKTITQRYGEDIAALEIWNEPNFKRFWKGSEEDFFHLTKETLKVLDETVPHIPVAVGALSYHWSMRGRTFLKNMIKAGVLDGADAVSIHPYGVSLQASAARVEGVQKLLNKHQLDHEIWITEIGYPTTGLYPHRVRLENHASFTGKALVLMAASGADMITWYKLFDKYTPDEKPFYTGSESSFGLLYPDYSRKPGAYSYSSLSAALQNSTYNPRGIQTEGVTARAFRIFCFDRKNSRSGKDERSIILWGDNPEVVKEIEIEGFSDYILTELNGKDSISGSCSGLIRLLIGKTPVLVTGTVLPDSPPIRIR